MMNAKEMFEKLHYKQIRNDVSRIVYSNGIGTIEFVLKHKFIGTYYVCDKINDIKTIMHIDINELQAINKQVNELKWYKEEVKANES